MQVCLQNKCGYVYVEIRTCTCMDMGYVDMGILVLEDGHREIIMDVENLSMGRCGRGEVWVREDVETVRCGYGDEEE